jgi:hypothetical protein
MSSLEWTTAVYMQQYGSHREPCHYYELWRVGEDRTAWYNMPCASIRKVKERHWEITFPDSTEGRILYFKTLKEAKAMGIALVRMDDGI